MFSTTYIIRINFIYPYFYISKNNYSIYNTYLIIHLRRSKFFKLNEFYKIIYFYFFNI